MIDHYIGYITVKIQFHVTVEEIQALLDLRYASQFACVKRAYEISSLRYWGLTYQRVWTKPLWCPLELSPPTALSKCGSFTCHQTRLSLFLKQWYLILIPILQALCAQGQTLLVVYFSLHTIMERNGMYSCERGKYTGSAIFYFCTINSRHHSWLKNIPRNNSVF